MIQGSPEWFSARLGKVTSSGIAAVLSKGRNGGIPVTRNSYMDDLIAERMLGLDEAFLRPDREQRSRLRSLIWRNGR